MKVSALESTSLEFKEKVPAKRQFLKTVIAFANLHGGKILFGVRDDGEVIGVEDDPQDLMEQLCKMVYDSSAPTIVPRMSIESYGDLRVVVLEVSSGPNKPYRLKGEDLGVFIRVGNMTLKATPEIIQELQWQTQGRSYDEMPCYGVSVDDLMNEQILKIIQRKRSPHANSISTNITSSLKLHQEENGKTYPTQGAVLMFHAEPQLYFSEAFTICSVFAGTVGREILSTLDLTGPIFEQLEQANAFILKNLQTKINIGTDLRHEVAYEIPPVAIREALINAFVHRNYHHQAPIKVAIYSDRIEIFSPGGFVGPMNPDAIEMGVTYIRNKVIARWFREAGLMEKLGSGLPTIFESYRQANLSLPSIAEVGQNVKVILPRTKSSPESEERVIIRQLQNYGPKSISDLLPIVGLPRSTLGRKLSRMVSEKILVSSGKGRSLVYHLALGG
jgi:ATP-dependent DNA helicase RecG